MPIKLPYPKGDLRRMLSVLGAIDKLGNDASMVNVARATLLPGKTVVDLVEKAMHQAGVKIVKNGPVFHISHWGPVITREGCGLALDGLVGNEPKAKP